MSARIVANSARRRRRMITYLWIMALAVVTISLIYWELTALLYILATLGVTALLIVVAKADLAGAEKASSVLVSPEAVSVANVASKTNPTGGNRQTWGAKKRT